MESMSFVMSDCCLSHCWKENPLLSALFPFAFWGLLLSAVVAVEAVSLVASCCACTSCVEAVVL